MTTPTASGQWDTFTLIGLPIAAFVVLLLIAATVYGIWRAKRAKRSDSSYEREDVPWFYGASAITAAIALAITVPVVLTYWPFDAAYHQYRPVTGKVAAIASRLAGNGATQKFVVTLHGSSQQYGVSDTRAALVRVGDTVHLRCIRIYEYGSNDAGFDCKWGQ